MTVATLPNFGQRITARRTADLDYEMVVDNFAGAGGASLGIEAAIGRAVDKAINHSPFALEIHGVNHPDTEHLCGNIWDYAPLEVTQGRPVGLAWFSPDCKHFSRAKGGKPVEKKIRGLAWVVIRWAKEVRPRVIILENVPEFQTWGPLTADNTPCPNRKGQTFKRWKRQLERLGYAVETRELVAADYGVPTIRKRFFLIARCDGQPIVWPERTHAPRHKAAGLNLLPWRPASECIEWELPCPSIFTRKRPLAEATMKRIANGIRRYVIESAEPFIVTCNHQGGDRTRSINDPMMTLTSRRDAHGVVTPFVAQVQNASNGFGCADLQQPFPTVTANPKGGGHALVEAFIAKHYGGVVGHDLNRPIGTVTSVDHHSLAAATLTQFRGTNDGKGDMRDPMPAVTAGGHHIGEVRAFLVAYFGSEKDGQGVRSPMRTVTTKERLGLVTVDGTEYVIADIGLRMLTPRELLRAQFGRFANEYVLIGTKAQQVAAIGNSVPPELAEALVRANVQIKRVDREAAA